MKKLTIPSLGVCAGALVLAGCSPDVKVLAQEVPSSERQKVELTICKNFASVSEERSVHLVAGHNTLNVDRISKLLDQGSVLYRLPGAEKTEVVASTYNLGASDSNDLLKHYLGKQVDLVRYNQDGKEVCRTKARLDVVEDSRKVLFVDGKYLVNPPGEIEANAEGGFATLPALSVQADSPKAQDARMGVSYLTQGLSWQADYTMTLAGDKSAALDCWASVENQTGIEYPEAKLTFVSGAPNRAVQFRASAGLHVAEDMSGFAPTSFHKLKRSQMETTGELYSYKVEQAATLNSAQLSRVKMLASAAVVIEKDYAVRLNSQNYEYYGGPTGSRVSATLTLNFKNAEKTGLGMPLPGGAVRVYEPDDKGQPIYIGAAEMNDTPKDTGVNLTISEVFDVWALAKTKGVKTIDRRTRETSYEATLHNSKAVPVKLRVVQDFYGTWKMARESQKSTRPGADQAQWLVTIPATSEVKLSFAVRTR